MADEEMTVAQRAMADRETELDKLTTAVLADVPDDDTCVLCQATMLVHDGCEPTPICDSCAQLAAAVFATAHQDAGKCDYLHCGELGGCPIHPVCVACHSQPHDGTPCPCSHAPCIHDLNQARKNLAAAQAAKGLTVDELTLALRNIDFDLTCGACAGQFYTGAGMGEHTCSRAPKYGIMHPSDRPLGLNHAGEETWGADDRPVLFDTIGLALRHWALRSQMYPKSDWRDARVVKYTPGVAKVHPTWEDVPTTAKEPQ